MSGPTGAQRVFATTAYGASATSDNKVTPLVLTMEISEKDLTLRQGIRGHSYKHRQNVNFAYDTGGSFIHGNVLVHVMQGRSDVSAQFKVERYMQIFIWKLKPVPDINTDDGTLLWRGERTDVAPWSNDCLTPTHIWLDVPGEELPPKDFPSERYLQEFAWGIKECPTGDMLYYIVVTDTRPGRYRSRIFPAINISRSTWATIKRQSSNPYRDENGDKPLFDTGWIIRPT